MAQNRYLPFGYRMQNGQIVINESEAEVVRKMFRRYANGSALKAIAEQLSISGPAYIEGKPTWNKNMVARILQNPSYLGTEKYPEIVDDSTASAVKMQKEKKPYTLTEPTAIKKLKRLFVCGVCGELLGRRIKTGGGERWHCHSDCKHISTYVNDALLLKNIHSLFCTLHQRLEIQTTGEQDSIEPTATIIKLQNEIDLMFDREICDEKHMTELILQLATEKYKACNDARIIAVEVNAQPENDDMSDVADTKRILETVSQIIIDTTGAVSMKLKNGQIVDGRRTRHE